MESLTDLARSCLEAFEQISQRPLSTLACEKLTRESMRFANWCVAHDVFLAGHSSLDEMLQERPELRQELRTAMRDISSILDKRAYNITLEISVLTALQWKY